MRSFTVLVSMCLVCLLFASCSREEDRGEEPVLTLLSSGVIKIPSEGCDTAIFYSVTNSSDVAVSVSTDQEDWITDLVLADEGAVRFSVMANKETQKRYGHITLSGRDAGNEIHVGIVQECEADDLPESVSNDYFSVGITDLTAVSVTVHVVPVDNSMRYVTMVRPEVQVAVMDDDELSENDMLYFESYSQASFLPLEEVIKLFSAVGEKDIRLYGLEQGTDYCFYVYGITSDLCRATDICRIEFTTDVVDYRDVEFDIDICLDGYTANVNVSASDQSLPFYFDLKEGELFRNGDPDKIVAGLISDLFAEYAAYGFPADYVIGELGSIGSGSYTFSNLMPLTEYVVYAAALDYEGMVVSKAAYEYFTTGSPGDASLLTVSYRISDISARGAYVEVFPSDKTVKYFWDVVPEGTSSAQVKQMIENTAAHYIGQGTASGFNDFMADILAVRGDGAYRYGSLDGGTEYVTYSFGITESGDYATDIMFGDTFTTLQRQVSDAAVEVTYDKYFDSEDVAAVYPQFPGISGMAIVPSVVGTNSAAAGYYYAVSHGDLTDSLKYPDDMVIEQLVMDGMTEPMPYWLKYGDVTYLAIAYDKNGNYGKLFRCKHTLTKEGVSPVSEFNPGAMSAELSVPVYAPEMENQAVCRNVAVKANNEIHK